MITITNKKIENIPVLELSKEEFIHQEIPIVVFHHGWTNCKETAIGHGYELAKKGFRAVLPDALHHGERKSSLSMEEAAMQFWPIIFNSIEELTIIKEYYREKYGKTPSIGVAGLSMGGITTAAMLTQYDWIKAAAIEMGSVNPTAFTKWLEQSENVTEVKNALPPSRRKELDNLYRQLDEISLEKQPEKIAGRPVYFWHAKDDKVVPFLPTYQFVEKIKNESFAQNISFTIQEEGGHRIPYKEKRELANFFEKHLTE